jgi:hypothetical protein
VLDGCAALIFGVVFHLQFLKRYRVDHRHVSSRGTWPSTPVQAKKFNFKISPILAKKFK